MRDAAWRKIDMSRFERGAVESWTLLSMSFYGQNSDA
jgi:hypothetical protein